MLQQVKKRQIDAIERFAIKATQSIGSTNSILVHTALFMMSFMMYFIGFDLNNNDARRYIAFVSNDLNKCV